VLFCVLPAGAGGAAGEEDFGSREDGFDSCEEDRSEEGYREEEQGVSDSLGCAAQESVEPDS